MCIHYLHHGSSIVELALSLSSHSPILMNMMLVGKKFVWVWPGFSDFLSELSTFAIITVWSLMLESTTRDICSYLFGPSLINPCRILG